MSGDHLLHPASGSSVRLSLTPESAGWDYLSFAVVALDAGDSHHVLLPDQELAIVPLSGSGRAVAVAGAAGAESFDLSRTSVFTQMPHVLYAPPRTEITVTTESRFEFAIGSAPAQGKYPLRLFAPAEMKTELRGGGTAYRQVNHILAMPLPAEHLILYEVYVPRGTWGGWAPHNHDGRDGSPYLEEVYYFRMDPPEGFLMQRNWRDDEHFDEVFVAHDGDCVLVTKGYHSTVACPTSHLYFLNYLAGTLFDEERITPPCFNAAYTWIQDNWDQDAWTLPVVPRSETVGEPG